MRIVSLLGLIVLIGIAWLMSYHPSKVKLKTIAWGVGLQVVFAFIILRKDVWSFVGMSVLAGLLGVYASREMIEKLGGKVVHVVGILLLCLALGATAYVAVDSVPLGWGLFVLLILVLANSVIGIRKSAQPILLMGLFSMTVGYLYGRNITGQAIFKALGDKVAAFLNLSEYGAKFLFGNLADQTYAFPSDGSWPGFGFMFAFRVLPTIIFFGGMMGVLYKLGIMQRVIQMFSHFMRWTIGTSGAETLSCSANIFVGQTEAPLLIRPFLKDMTNSELLTVMVGGFATIAGGVLAGYIAWNVPADHLIAASVMSAPAALVVGKIIFPETEHSATAGDVELPEIEVGSNVLEAASNGIGDGLKLAVNVGAMLIGFIALIAVVDVILSFLDGWIDGRILGNAYYAYPGDSGFSAVTGEFAGIFPGSLKTLFGFTLRPLAWLMGVPWEDAASVGNLLGVKLALNEFVAYGELRTEIASGAIGERAQIISTYALCGFANFSSIGIQIGGIGALAPERRGDLSKLALKAMFGGAIASWMTATIAGMLL